MLDDAWRRGALTALACLCAAAGSVPAAAQSLYMPRNIKHAVANGTRTLDGRPGARYWQNHGRYTMTITVMPPDRRVSGTEHITYVNESPDTLPGVVIRLFQNYHEPGAPRDGGTTKAFLTSGEHIDAFAVNGKPQAFPDNPRYFTWVPVRLPAPLAPHDSVRLSFTWHYDVSERAGREGAIDSTTYFLAYFYPRVSVYDDANGWDTMDHSGHEFYSDFNDYDVSIQAPHGFVVWGTGTLQHPEDVLQPDILKRYQSSFTSDATIHVATHAEMADNAVTAQHPLNVWRFTARDVPDMAFGLSDHYDWDAASVLVDAKTRRRASVQAAYNDTAADFRQMVRYGRHALSWFSANWPGVPYPYEKSTIFQGGAGMEYPMMVNDGAYSDTVFSRFVAEHEIAHTYMPFYMGIDETRYAFMDEGWATTLEHLIGTADLGPARADTFFQQFRVTRWIHNPSPLSDLPIITPADALTGPSYGDNAYGKAALGYLAMKDLLGDDLFAKCLHAYMDRWHGKHPSPWDFFYTFDNVSGRKLDWFWRVWYFTNGYIDLAVAGVRKARGGYDVDIKNIGGFDAPVDLV
ncbi:MAG TPA: M1 family metallopeptidase, partial [Longimicrobiales bacterium]|nr:M1 family metallopeptidase [Longimicrobiales bacterium]